MPEDMDCQALLREFLSMLVYSMWEIGWLAQLDRLWRPLMASTILRLLQPSFFKVLAATRRHVWFVSSGSG